MQSKAIRISKPSAIAAVALSCVLGSGGVWYASTDIPEWSSKYDQAYQDAREAGVYMSFDQLVAKCDDPEAKSSSKQLARFFTEFESTVKRDLKTLRKVSESESELLASYAQVRPLLPALADALRQPTICLPPMGSPAVPITRDWKRTHGVSLYVAKWADLAMESNNLEMAGDCWLALAQLTRIKDELQWFDEPYESQTTDYALARGVSQKGSQKTWRDKLRRAIEALGPGADPRRVLQFKHAVALQYISRSLSDPTRMLYLPGTGSPPKIVFERDKTLYALGKLPAFRRATLAHLHSAYAKGIRRLGTGAPSIETIISATSAVDLSPVRGKLSYAIFEMIPMSAEYSGTQIVTQIARRNVLRQALAMLDSGQLNSLPLKGEVAKDRDGKRLRLKQEPYRVVLYSIGDDGGDNGGKVGSLPGYSHTAPDYGVVIRTVRPNDLDASPRP